MITATIGRVVWFRLPAGECPQYFTVIDDNPCAAMIVYVHDDRCVNLMVMDHHGARFAMTRVKLRQPGERVPNGSYCEWMPFQVGQAAGLNVQNVSVPCRTLNDDPPQKGNDSDGSGESVPPAREDGASPTDEAGGGQDVEGRRPPADRDEDRSDNRAPGADPGLPPPRDGN